MGLLLRRRTMMEQAQQPSNLVLSLPLSYNGDLTEIVSGSNRWNNTNYMTWDAAENAYLFEAKTNSNSTYLAGLNLPVSTIHNLNWTVEFDIKAASFTQYIPCMTLYNGNNCVAAQYLYDTNGTNGGYAPAKQWAHVKIVRHLGGSIDYYTDDVYVCSKTQGDATITPNNFSPLASPWSSAGNGSKAYVKNITITLN